MRFAVLLLAASIVSTACFPENRSYRRDTAQPQVFEAYTTDGDSVMVEQDPQNGNLYIVQPVQLRGEAVALVNRDSDGRMLVTREVQRRQRYQGSGGDAERRDEHRRHDEGRGDDHR